MKDKKSEDNKLKALENLKKHIMETEKDNKNYEERLKDIEDKIKKYKENKRWNNTDQEKYLKSFNSKYTYIGPIKLFDKVIATAKQGEYETRAASINQAKVYLEMQIKEKLGYEKNSKITIIPNLIKEVN